MSLRDQQEWPRRFHNPADPLLLPEGVDFDGEDYTAYCCRCGKQDVLDFDISDLKPDEEYRHYCGSQFCMP